MFFGGKRSKFLYRIRITFRYAWIKLRCYKSIIAINFEDLKRRQKRSRKISRFLEKNYSS